MERVDKNKLIVSTIMLYILSATKLIVPLVSLPYLTRVLSIDCYGGVSFVKSIITYLQVFVDFGFLYSGTRDIVKLIKNKEPLDAEVGNILYAQILLWTTGFVFMLSCIFFIQELEGFELYLILSTISVLLSIFIFEHVFRAIQKMGVITLRFAIVKLLSLVLTLIFVKSDNNIILIPIFDIVASIVAIIPVFIELKKLGVRPNFNLKRIKDAVHALKKSVVFFLSQLSMLSFSTLNTIFIALILTKIEVAHWSVAMQLVTAVTVLYNPIINSVYPTMLKERNLNVVHKILMLFMPLISVGCVMIWLWGEAVVSWVLTDQYIESAVLLKYLIPVLVISFPSMIFSWPCFSVMDKEKTNTVLTIIAAGVQIIGLIILVIIDKFSLVNLVVVKTIAEGLLCALRVAITYKNRKLFSTN